MSDLIKSEIRMKAEEFLNVTWVHLVFTRHSAPFLRDRISQRTSLCNVFFLTQLLITFMTFFTMLPPVPMVTRILEMMQWANLMTCFWACGMMTKIESVIWVRNTPHYWATLLLAVLMTPHSLSSSCWFPDSTFPTPVDWKKAVKTRPFESLKMHPSV